MRRPVGLLRAPSLSGYFVRPPCFSSFVSRAALPLLAFSHLAARLSFYPRERGTPSNGSPRVGGTLPAHAVGELARRGSRLPPFVSSRMGVILAAFAASVFRPPARTPLACMYRLPPPHTAYKLVYNNKSSASLSRRLCPWQREKTIFFLPYKIQPSLFE